MSSFVSIVRSEVVKYPKNPPFNPPVIYPEFEGKLAQEIDETNKIFSLVRDALRLLGLDKENFGTKAWNPFKDLIKPGNTVFIKPNMISEKHSLRPDEWDYVITHGSVIRPIIDYVYLALEGKGRVIIGDAPQTDSNFFEIIKLMGLREIRDIYSKYKNFHLSIINLQDEYWVTKDEIIIDYINLPGDPLGGVLFDLGKESFFSEFDNLNKKYYGASYNIQETNEAHSNGHHKYWVAKSPIIADVFINVPKLKTHKKCGITINLKSLVGITANKNFLPHYVFGSPQEGGDQFSYTRKRNKFENYIVVNFKKLFFKKNKFLLFLGRKFKKVGYFIFRDTEKIIRSGNWWGNDTVWRMSLDLNKILMYGNTDGTLRTNYNDRKKFFSIVDGILGMEGNGPVAGDRVECGIIIAGDDPVSVDATAAKIMGFDPKKLKIISKCYENSSLKLTNSSLSDIVCLSNYLPFNKKLLDIDYNDTLKFKPYFGWKGAIEDSSQTVELCFLGDISLTSRIYDNFNNYGWIVDANVVDYINSADIISANFEFPIKIGSKRRHIFTRDKFICKEEYLNIIKNIKWSFFSIANNHISDWGEDSIKFTKLKLKDISLFSPIGAGVDLNEAIRPLRIERNGIKFSFISLCKKNISNATKKKSGSSPLNKKLITDIIEREKNEVDHIIVLVHWGTEFIHFPNDEQLKFENLFSKLGVSLVVGSHPHIIQGHKRSKKTLTFFSLGNFIADLSLDFKPKEEIFEKSHYGLILKVKFNKNLVIDVERKYILLNNENNQVSFVDEFTSKRLEHEFIYISKNYKSRFLYYESLNNLIGRETKALLTGNVKDKIIKLFYYLRPKYCKILFLYAFYSFLKRINDIR